MAQYIDKSEVIAEIERLQDAIRATAFDDRISKEQAEAYRVCVKLRSFVEDTLEVKEVDLDNDLFEEVYSHLDDIKDTADRMTSGNFMHHKAAIKFSANVIEKVLGLIGLKTQKEE